MMNILYCLSRLETSAVPKGKRWALRFCDLWNGGTNSRLERHVSHERSVLFIRVECCKKSVCILAVYVTLDQKLFQYRWKILRAVASSFRLWNRKLGLRLQSLLTCRIRSRITSSTFSGLHWWDSWCIWRVSSAVCWICCLDRELLLISKISSLLVSLILAKSFLQGSSRESPSQCCRSSCRSLEHLSALCATIYLLSSFVNFFGSLGYLFRAWFFEVWKF